MDWVKGKIGQIIALVSIVGTLAGFGYTGATYVNRIENLEKKIGTLVETEDAQQAIEDRKIVVRNGAVMRDLLFVEDCIDAVLKLSVTGAAEDSVFNIGSGHIVSISDVARAAVAASGQLDVDVTDLEEFIAYSPTAIIADID